MMDLLVGLSSLWVSICYFLIGGLVIPTLRFPPWATVMAGAFFIGCALTHVHITAEAFAPEVHTPGDAWTMIVLHVVQGVGGTGFIWAISTKRLVVRLEE